MRPYKQARCTDAHAGSPSASLFAQYVCSDDEDALQECAEAILEDLDASHSLLRGMFKAFLQEANILPSAKHSRTLYSHQPNLHQAKRPRDTEMLLTVTLEDLYNGAVKLVPVQRQKLVSGSHAVPVQQQLQVHIQPGLKEGTRVTLPGQGNEDCYGTSSDLTFIIQQQLHPTFRRLHDDLYAIVNVPLVTALTGGPVSLRTLSGQLLQLPTSEIITPASELVLPNLGMPVYGDKHGRRGALHVKFNVNFPQQLSQRQQLQLKMALAGVEEIPMCRPSAGLPALPAADHGQPQQQHQQYRDVDLFQYSTAKQHQQQQWQSMLAQAHSSGPSGCSSAYAYTGVAGHGSSMCDAAAGSSAACSSSGAGFACTSSTNSSRYNSGCTTGSR